MSMHGERDQQSRQTCLRDSDLREVDSKCPSKVTDEIGNKRARNHIARPFGFLASAPQARCKRQWRSSLFRDPNMSLEIRGVLSSSSANTASYRFSHSMHSAQSKVAQFTFSWCLCGRSPTFAKTRSRNAASSSKAHSQTGPARFELASIQSNCTSSPLAEEFIAVSSYPKSPYLQSIDHLSRRTAVAVKPRHKILQLHLVFLLRFKTKTLIGRNRSVAM